MGRMDVTMDVGLGELDLRVKNNQEFDQLLEGVLRKSPIWDKYAVEYANKFAAEERFPLKQEYIAMLEDLSNKVMDEDKSVQKNLAFLTIYHTIFNEDFIAELKKEFAQELEAFEQSKSNQ